MLADTITGAQLMHRWGTNSHHDLSYWILTYQLSVVDSIRVKAASEAHHAEITGVDIEKLLKMIQDNPSALSEKLFWVPEIEQIETEHNLRVFKSGETVSFETLQVPEAIKDVLEFHDKEIEKSNNVFSRLGAVWFVKFRQEEWGFFPDQEKYKYIAHLLSLSNHNPSSQSLNFSVHNTDLVSQVKGKDPGDFYGQIDEKEVTDYFKIDNGRKTDEEDKHKNQKEELGLSDLKDNLSREDLKRFKEIGYKQLDELKEAEKSGDPRLINKNKEILKEYKSILSNEYNIKAVLKKNGEIYFKEYHRTSKEIEKTRQIIKNQIKNAKKDLNERMPMFVKHLDNSLKTKLNQTVYSPESQIHWYVSM